MGAAINYSEYVELVEQLKNGLESVALTMDESDQIVIIDVLRRLDLI